MSLPKVAIPQFKVHLPSDNKEVYFRPFLVKEEKALLMAIESKDENVMAKSIMDILDACIMSEDVDIKSKPYFDLEYFFLNLRAKSVGEIVKFDYRHVNSLNRQGDECKAVTEVSINLEDIKVQFNPEHKNVVQLNDQISLKMKYPNLYDIVKMSQAGFSDLDVISSCIDSAFDANQIYDVESLAEARQLSNR